MYLSAAIVAVMAAPSLAQQPPGAEKDARPATGPAAPASPPQTAGAPAAPRQPAQGAQGAAPPPKKPLALAIPEAAELLMLMRTTLIALNQANFTGNYTVLHGLGTPALRAKNSPAQLGIAFTGLRNEGLDLSPVVALSPELTESPTITPNGILRLAGYFPTKPLQTNFVMVFQPVGRRWMLDALSVSTSRPPNATAGATVQPQPAGQAKSADGAAKEKRK